FVAGKTFRITASFSDGTTATADTPLVARPPVTDVTAVQACPRQTVSVKIAGSNFQPGAQVNFGADIAVSGVSVDSSSQISATLEIGRASCRERVEVTVVNAAGQEEVVSSGLTLSRHPPTYTITHLGK